jgi:hypothetical protein
MKLPTPKIGDTVIYKALANVEYDEKGNRRVIRSKCCGQGFVVGLVRRAEGMYHGRYCSGLDFDDEPPYLAVDHYVMLYELRKDVRRKPFLVHPDDIIAVMRG